MNFFRNKLIHPINGISKDEWHLVFEILWCLIWALDYFDCCLISFETRTKLLCTEPFEKIRITK